jgi:hypothetical protein
MSVAMQTQVKSNNLSSTSTCSALVQRKCADAYCDETKKKLIMQRNSINRTEPSKAPPIVHEVLSSPGQPLDPKTREFMESHFSHDFSKVKVHTDAKAVESARAVNARAYTLGHHVVYGDEEYTPATSAGRFLLAHELTHVVQQKENNGYLPESLPISDTDHPAEHEADTIAKKVITGESSVNSIRNFGSNALHRIPIINEIVRGYLGYRCLKPLFPQMRRTTRAFNRNFCRTLPRRETSIRLRYSGRSMAPRSEGTTITLTGVPNNYYDAFGHCWIACEGSRRCGRATTARLGTARELYRELDQDPHDSFRQDINNQGYGRELSEEEGTCSVLCERAVTQRRLDLSAPTRHCVDCSTFRTTTQCGRGVQATPERREEGGGWLPRT